MLTAQERVWASLGHAGLSLQHRLFALLHPRLRPDSHNSQVLVEAARRKQTLGRVRFRRGEEARHACVWLHEDLKPFALSSQPDQGGFALASAHSTFEPVSFPPGGEALARLTLQIF